MGVEHCSSLEGIVEEWLGGFSQNAEGPIPTLQQAVDVAMSQVRRGELNDHEIPNALSEFFNRKRYISSLSQLKDRQGLAQLISEIGGPATCFTDPDIRKDGRGLTEEEPIEWTRAQAVNLVLDMIRRGYSSDRIKDRIRAIYEIGKPEESEVLVPA